MNRAGKVASAFGSYGVALWWFSSIEQGEILSLEKSITAFGIFYATSAILHVINILFEELVKINWNLIYMDIWCLISFLHIFCFVPYSKNKQELQSQVKFSSSLVTLTRCRYCKLQRAELVSGKG